MGCHAYDGKAIKAMAVRNPAELPWGDMGVDVVVESTGIFTARADGGKPGYDTHLKAGAKRVVLSAPAKDGADLTCVLGVNDDKLTPDPDTDDDGAVAYGEDERKHLGRGVLCDESSGNQQQ